MHSMLTKGKFASFVSRYSSNTIPLPIHPLHLRLCQHQASLYCVYRIFSLSEESLQSDEDVLWISKQIDGCCCHCILGIRP